MDRAVHGEGLFVPDEPVDLGELIDLKPGSAFDGKYEIIETLGEGSMGMVVLARDRFLGREVAIKILKPDMAERIEGDARFRQEARLMSRLTHPNIVTVYAFGATESGVNYIVMEYVGGGSLAAYVRQDNLLPWSVVASLATQVCEALSSAHKLGVVHRDIKPGNILLGSEEDGNYFAKVVDFGLAKVLAKDALGSGEWNETNTMQGTAIGTPAYLSPEQAKGVTVDPRSDIYSLAMVVSHLLTGRLPFKKTSGPGLLMAHVYDEPTLPSGLAGGTRFPPEGPVDHVLRRAFAKTPGDRYQDVLAFGRELARAMGSTGADGSIVASGAAPVPEAQAVETVTEGMVATAIPEAASEFFQAAILHVEVAELWDEDGGVSDEEALECLGVVAAKIKQAIAAHDGELITNLASRQVAAFRAATDEPAATEAAVSAALELRLSLGALARDPTLPPSFSPRCQMGLDVGRLGLQRARDLGTVAHGEPLFGARAAARHASLGQVRLTRRAYRQVRDRFSFEGTYSFDSEVGPSVEGYQAPVRLQEFTVCGLPVDLVGRRDQVAQLATSLDDLLTLSGVRSLVLTGPPGVGKTRLFLEFLKESESRPEPICLETGRCTRTGARLLYQPFLEAIRSRASIVEDDSPGDVRAKLAAYVARCAPPVAGLGGMDDRAVVAALETLFGVEPSAEGAEAGASQVATDGATRGAIFERIAELYRRLASANPMLFFIDDFQWATQPTRSLLAYLMQHLGDVPALFILATREEGRQTAIDAMEREQTPVVVVDVEPLSGAKTRELVEHVLRLVPDPPRALVEGMVDLSQGIPLIVEETIYDLFDEGALRQDGDAWAVGASLRSGVRLPRTVEQLFLGRVHRLPDPLKAAVEAAAVAGDLFWPDLVNHLVEGSLDPRTIPDLEERGFIVPVPTVMLDGNQAYAFSQKAVREMVYGGMDQDRKQTLHRAVGAWLVARARGAATPLDGLTSHHFLAADEPLEALPHLHRAAHGAMHIHAIGDAADHFQSCHEVLMGLTDRDLPTHERNRMDLDVLGDLVRLRVLLGDMHLAVELADVGLGLDNGTHGAAHSAANRARLGIWKGNALMRLGQYPESLHAYRRALDELPEGGGVPLRLEAIAGAADVLRKTGHETAAELKTAISDVPNALAGDPDVQDALSACYRALGLALMQSGALPESTEAMDRAFALAVAARSPEKEVEALAGTAMLREHQGDMDAASRATRRALETAERWDFQHLRTRLLNNLADFALMSESWDEAVELAARAEALAVQQQYREVLADCQRIRAEALLALGQLEEAESVARDAVATCAGVSVPKSVGYAHRALARVLGARAQGAGKDADLDNIAEHLRRSIDAFRQGGHGTQVEETEGLRGPLLSGVGPAAATTLPALG